MYPVIILCGGRGTRLGSITDTIPKPMVRIGDEPILVHIMRRFVRFGFRDFVLATGYKHEMMERDFTRDIGWLLAFDKNRPELTVRPAIVRCIYTGDDATTGSRILQAVDKAEISTPFLLAYGDGLANVDLFGLTKFHSLNDGLVTLTAVHPPARFGALTIDGVRITGFKEKGECLHDAWVNGGFMVIDQAALDYIHGDEMWEHGPLERLAADGKLFAFKHDGFFWGMDTPRDLEYLNELWASGKAEW